MNYRYPAKHTENATDLYELRLTWLNDPDIHASAVESVEERLNASLFRCDSELHSNKQEAEPTKNKNEPSKEAECFIFLASHINSAQPDASTAGYDLAYQWLALDQRKSAAAEAALSLYPEADQTRLLKLYDEQETLRPNLLRIFRKQMVALPLEMVTTAVTNENASTALKIEALRYAAANPDFGLNLFRTHYVLLLSGKTQFDAAIVEAALWGGMVRNDPDAIQALSADLSHAGAATEHAKFMRLAALTGNAEFLPLLVMAAENNPDTGYPLLVLFGQKSVMPEILNGLEIAHTMEQAAAAFNKLTDQILPRVPRLTVVGEEADDAEESPEQIPDIKAAHAWWDKHQANWKTDERWLFGKPATPMHLTALCKKHAGSFGRDMLARLELSNKVPLNIPTETWRARQTQLLDAQLNVKPKPNATPAAIKQASKPASTRHA